MSDFSTPANGPADPSPRGEKSPRLPQGPGGFLPPSVSTSVTSAPFAFGGADPADSAGARPALGGESASPFADGPVAYTTRPPWMVSQPAPGASMDSGPCFLPDHEALAQSIPSEMPSTVGYTQAPFGSPQVVPPPGQTAVPFGTPAATPGAVKGADDDKDAWYNKAPTYSSGRGKDRSVLLKLFVLLVKLMPAAMVLYGGYYGYQQFFGELSSEELAAFYGTSGGAATPAAGGPAGAAGGAGGGAAIDGEAPKSRVGIMLQQAKDSIAAHDQNVHMANAIADNPGNLDAIQDSFDNLEAAVAAKAAPPQPEAKVKLAFDDGTVALGANGATGDGAGSPSAAEQALTNFTGPMSTSDRGADGAAPATASVTIAAPQLSAVEPSADFRAWVSRVNVSGVRVGSDPRAFVSGRLVRPGMTVDHRLGIRFSHVDGTARLLYFSDGAGAVLGKRY